MEISASVSLWVGIIGTLVGIVGLGIAIYQWAILNEKKKRAKEIQYLFVGMANIATMKVQKYYNLVNIELKESEERTLARIYNTMADDLSEVSSLATALESSIDPNSSASTEVLERNIKMSQLNNELQEESLKNPSRKKTK